MANHCHGDHPPPVKFDNRLFLGYAWLACSSTCENTPRDQNQSGVFASSERTRKVSLAEKSEQKQKIGYQRHFPAVHARQ
jgi:hypothetical protein